MIEEPHRECTSDELTNHSQTFAKRETIKRRATSEKLVDAMHPVN